MGHHAVPAAVGVALIMGIVFTLLIVSSVLGEAIQRRLLHHNLLQRPRRRAGGNRDGAMAIAFYMVLTLSATNDVIALKFHISPNATTWIGRIGMVVLPP